MNSRRRYDILWILTSSNPYPSEGGLSGPPAKRALEGSSRNRI
jgi:hypothetical protein